MHETTPYFSVLMPVYRPDPRIFKEALDSILGQTFGDFELLVVEDPSPGSSAEDLMEGVQDPRIRWLRLESRSSLVGQLNRGLRIARAPWIARMDADDIALPERLAEQKKRLEQDPDLDVLGTQIEVIDHHSRLLGFRQFPESHRDIVRALASHNPISHPSVVFRKSLALQLGGYRYPGEPAEDYELWSRMAHANAHFANLESAQVRYRLHEQGVKAQKIRRTLEATLLTKRLHWMGHMTASDRAQMWMERIAWLLPPKWVYWAGTKARYQKVADG